MNQTQLSNSLRLSQCMIVKNEEDNIEKALNWAKEIAFEQIVVDTGSTDRTIEIAKKHGAKVYCFDWINDFAAAKNFAIEKASGDWIAFLDADEYFDKNDAPIIMKYLDSIHEFSSNQKQYLALLCKMYNIDETGKPLSIITKTRVFRNIPNIRYTGRIHEQLTLNNNDIMYVDDITIIHTGYSETAYKTKNKSTRNIDLLRVELIDNPDDPNLKTYLADAMCMSGDETLIDEAMVLYREAIDSDLPLIKELQRYAYMHLLERLVNVSNNYDECEILCLRALKDWVGDIDFEYYLGVILFNKGDYLKAWGAFNNVEKKILNEQFEIVSTIVTARPLELFERMVIVAATLGDVENVLKYASITLSLNKDNHEVLEIFIATLLNKKTTEEELLFILSEYYDTSDPNELIIIARAANNSGKKEFAYKIVDLVKTLIA
ncbi:MAG: glycosyltransferase family 2 protein [Oscillospiraceae bacterium]|nr:glycosyltransferase family 2 protein [Oscillospiraceae bacterium]